jgi:hypothetical protein
MPMLRAGGPTVIAVTVAVTVSLGVATSAGASRRPVTAADKKTPPSTSITDVTHHHRRAEITFSSSEPESTFKCKLDHRGFQPCASPKRYRGLSSGRHVVKVRAKSGGLVDPTPVGKSFRTARPPYPPLPKGKPPVLMHGDTCEFSTELIWPTHTEWEVSSRRRLTDICAGADARHRSTGRFVILRQNYLWDTQSLDTVDVPHSGPVRITHAPTGARVEDSAQLHGRLRFTSKRDVSGTLRLRNDTVRLTGTD